MKPSHFVRRGPRAIALLEAKLLLAVLFVGLPAAARAARAAEPPPARVLKSSLGVTRKGASIPCLMTADDLDPFTKKTRVLLIGSGEETAPAIEAFIEWYARQPEAGWYRLRYAFSAVPQLNPDRRPLDERHPLGPLPDGDAYRSSENPEAQYLWRWIGMHAPDLVVVLHGDAPHALVASTFENSKLQSLREGPLFSAASLATGGLSRRLVSEAPCETGSIEAIDLQLGQQDAVAAISQLASQLTEAGFTGPSPARRALQQRLRRTPLEVAQQLATHYGRDLEQVVYIPALALIGRLRLGQLTGDVQQRRDVLRIVKPYLDGAKDSRPKNGSGLSGHLIFAALAEDSQGGDRRRLIDLARQAADLGLDEQGRAKSMMPFHSEMSDALFMGGPILTSVARLTENPRYVDACANHLRAMRKLDLREDGLYRHSPLDQAAWGRGNGFPALGLALCLSELPPESPHRDEFLRYYRDHMETLRKWQDPTGCWRQVVDRPQSYRELSCTCMITFAMLRGMRRGWLERAEYQPLVDRAWNAVRVRVAPDGRLVDVCTGTGKQKSLRDYYDRPAILGKDARGGAMALMLATERAFWEREQRQP